MVYWGYMYILEGAEFGLSTAFYFTKIGVAVPKLWLIKGENPTHFS